MAGLFLYSMETFIISILETSLLEWLAVSTGIAYVLLIAYQNRVGWVLAFISTLIYTYLCFISQLYIEASLQVFYVVMAVYGWLKWKHQTKQRITIQTWTLNRHLKFLIFGGVSVILLGYSIGALTNQASPYLDAFTTVFSLIATFMVARKVLENWWYWIVIDAGLIVLYASRGYVLTGVQYGLFTFLAFYGWMKWRKEFKLKIHNG